MTASGQSRRFNATADMSALPPIGSGLLHRLSYVGGDDHAGSTNQRACPPSRLAVQAVHATRP
jgi:hypothetical protein